MKRQLRNCFLTLLFLGYGFTQAQITITRSDFADINDITIGAHDTIFAGITPGNGGPSQNWNFSTLQNHYVDTNFFMAPSATPYPGFSATANIAAYNSLDSTYIFLDANTPAVNVVGYALLAPFIGVPTSISLSPPVTQITFPSNLNSSFNVSSAGQSQFYYSGTYTYMSIPVSFDSVRISAQVSRQSIIDGWGTTITPVGTFSTLRQKLTEITDVQVEAHVTTLSFGWVTAQPFGSPDTTIHYYYIANGQNWPVAEIQTNYSGVTTSAQYLLNVTNSVPELVASGKDIFIYPNPSAGEFNVTSLNGKAELLKVFDVRGEEVQSIAVNNSLKSLSLATCSSGIYMFNVYDRSGTVISTGKLAIQK